MHVAVLRTVVVCGLVSIGICVFSIGLITGTSFGATTAPAPSPSSAPVSPATQGYSCELPADYTALAYARTWIQLGDSFAAGAGASVPSESSWIALLRALARVRLGNDPAIINGVGTSADSLPEQIRLLQSLPAWHQLLAMREHALIFVSYGAEWLQARAEQGTQDAALSVVIDHLALLLGSSNASLIPPEAAGQFSVILVTHPDPTAGGVYVPVEYARCVDARSLNWPTLASRTAHAQIYNSMHTHLHALATRNGWGFVDTDAALGAHAWPSARASDGCAWRDCYSFNDRGHAMLAALLWSCLQRMPYSTTQ